MRTSQQRLFTFASRFAAIILIVFSLLVTRGVQPLRAQGGSCSDTVKLALQAALQVCSGIQRNQACYGNPTAEASPKAGASINFSAPGNTVSLTDVGSIRLSGYSSDTGTMGVALLQVPGGAAGTNVGSNVTVIVFGNTQIASAPGQQPMQAFYLRNGAAAPGCEQVAADGIMIQTPAGQQRVQLTVNGTQLTVGSTVFLSARSNADDDSKAELNIQTLEGEVTVEADGETIEVPAGAQTNVPLAEVNGEYEVDGEPEELEPLDQELFDDLPLDELPESLDLTELEDTWDTESDEIDEAATDEPEQSLDETPEPEDALDPTPTDAQEDTSPQPTDPPPVEDGVE